MKKQLAKFAQVAALALALAFTLSCSLDPDEDGDGSFKMSGERNSIGYYEYTFFNRSDWQVSVTVANSTTRKLTSKYSSVIITYNSDNATVEYSPTSKVKPERGSIGKVYFYNR